MKEDKKRFGQYANENHNYEIDNDAFLNQTAPLIGYVVHTFNQLDESLNNAIWELISDRSDKPGAIVTYKMNFAAKVDLFYRMVRSIEIGCEESIPSLQSLTEDLRKCATLRNAIIHAEWYNMDDNGYTYVKLNFDKNGMKQHYWQFTPESLEEIIKFIQQTYLSFDKYYEEKQDLFNR